MMLWEKRRENDNLRWWRREMLGWRWTGSNNDGIGRIITCRERWEKA
jgi:hypothetical protein